MDFLPGSAAEQPSPGRSRSCEEAAGLLLDWLDAHRRIFVLTGAGLSTPSGIPDYRDAEGRWKRRAPVTGPAFIADPLVRARYWARSFVGWPAVERAMPNRGHVALASLEARGRLTEGVSFLESVSDTWEDCNSFMYTHNWWHLALFLIDLDRTDEALALFDGRVWGVAKEFSEDQINAISLLARLELHGVDVGARWSEVSPYLEQRLHDHFVPFLDLHYLYALARAGKQSAVTEMLASLEDRAERAKPFEREAWADCAVPAAHGLAAHARGDYAEAARLLGQAMPHLQPIGGSIAQRALFGAIHLDALIRSGWNDAAVKILQADERERPAVPFTKRALADLYRKLGRAEQAMTADYQAAQLARRYAP